METHNWLSVNETASYLAITRASVIARIKRGSLKAENVGGMWQVDKADIEKVKQLKMGVFVQSKPEPQETLKQEAPEQLPEQDQKVPSADKEEIQREFNSNERESTDRKEADGTTNRSADSGGQDRSKGNPAPSWWY